MKKRILPVILCLFVLAGCATTPYQPPQTIAIPPGVGGIYHEVQRGDTLWRVSKTYGVDLVEIVRFNRLSDATKINVGQKIFIPGAKTPIEITMTGRELYERDLFVWPVKGEVLNFYGQESYGTRNKGIDIKAHVGETVVASKEGRVVFVSNKVKGLGNTIIIDHHDGFLTVYARNSQNLVKVGDKVAQNQVIAKAGSTGRGEDSYLHFEIRRGHKPQNPLYYLPS